MNSTGEIEKSLSGLCRGVDKKDDAMMLMAPESNWDQFLIPAPCAIAILGDLILISADTDFSLEDKPPKDGFRLLRYPNSFRASLVQVSNAGWSAFNEAHTSMDQIRLHTGNVDNHVKAAVQFLMKGTPEEVQHMLPMSLNKIQNIADECLRLAEAIEGKFVGVMELTGELLEACTSTKGAYDEKTKEIERAIHVAKVEEEARQREKEESKRRYENMSKEVSEAQADFKTAMENIPTGLDLLGLAAGEALIEGIRNVTSIPNLIKSSIKRRASGAVDDEVNVNEHDEELLDSELSAHRVYVQIGRIHKQIMLLVELATGNIDEQQRKSPDFHRISKGEASSVKEFLDKSRQNVENEKCSGTIREEVLMLCDQAIKVCNTLNYIVKQMTVEDKETRIQKAVEETKKISIQSQKLNCQASRKVGKNPLDNKSPHLDKMKPASSSATVVKAAVEESRYKTELAKESLKDTKRRQEKASEEMAKSNEKLIEVLKEMAKLDLTKIEFDAIRETLVKGIKALAQVREQWGQLVRFFQMLSNLIKCCLHSSLTDFVDQANVGRKLQMGTTAAPLSNIFRDVIFEQASKASQVAYVVHTISATYVEISNKHLMDRITSLGGLIALDPKKDQREIMQRREELHNGCQKAQQEIQSIVKKQKEEFSRRIDERIAKIAELEAKMPAIEPAKIREIQQTVSSGFSDTEVDDLI